MLKYFNREMFLKYNARFDLSILMNVYCLSSTDALAELAYFKTLNFEERYFLKCPECKEVATEENVMTSPEPWVGCTYSCIKCNHVFSGSGGLAYSYFYNPAGRQLKK